MPAGALPGQEKGAALVQRSDRELARLFVEMFAPIEDAVVIAFPDDQQAEKPTAPAHTM